MNAKMTVTTVAVATAKFQFGICDCRVNNDVDTSDFACVWTLHVCGHVHLSPGMD